MWHGTSCESPRSICESDDGLDFRMVRSEHCGRLRVNVCLTCPLFVSRVELFAVSRRKLLRTRVVLRRASCVLPRELCVRCTTDRRPQAVDICACAVWTRERPWDAQGGDLNEAAPWLSQRRWWSSQVFSRQCGSVTHVCGVRQRASVPAVHRRVRVGTCRTVVLFICLFTTCVPFVVGTCTSQRNRTQLQAKENELNHKPKKTNSMSYSVVPVAPTSHHHAGCASTVDSVGYAA